jgi:VCBS repeat-containing protein
VRYTRYRTGGASVSANSTLVEVGATADAASTTFVDTEELPNGVQFAYVVKAEVVDGLTGASNSATIVALNDRPVAQNDAYSVLANRQLVVNAAAGVLANDTDADSPRAQTVLVPQESGPSNGTLVLNPNGSFTYQPRNGFSGTDSFTYRVSGGTWPRDPAVPLSANSTAATVTIAVTKKK